MLIRYKGGRSFFEISLNRKPYYFTPENNRILDIKDQAVINYIFSLDNRAEFEVIETNIPIEPVTKTEEPKIDIVRKRGRPKKGVTNG